MGTLIFLLSIILGTILFLMLKLIKKFLVSGFFGNCIMWAICCVGALLLTLLLGKLLRGLLVVIVIVLVGYILVVCFRD